MPPAASDLSVSESDLPAPFHAADRASLRAQRYYLRLFGLDLATLVAGALFASLGDAKWTAILGAIALASSLVFTAVLAQNSFRKRWFVGRADAESIKTRSWRYMMRAEPFDVQDPSAADALFVADIQQLRQVNQKHGYSLTGPLDEFAHISDTMRAVRAHPLEARKTIYLRDRIRDQMKWYSSKSHQNSRKGAAFYGGVLSFQLLAFVATCLLLADVSLPLQPVGVASTLAAALLSWSQMRRHEELAQSYTAAWNDLGAIEARAIHENSEEAFSTFVADAESAISREHTFWLARRDSSSSL